VPSGIFPVPRFRPTARYATRPSLGLRVRTRRWRNQLDSELAQGVDPAASAELGLRAAQLRSASGRRELAAALVETLGDARGPNLGAFRTKRRVGLFRRKLRDELSALDRRGTAPMRGPVIVGVEASERSRDALALGRRLADDLGAELVAVYVHAYAELGGLLAGGPARETQQLIEELADAAHASVRELADEMDVQDLRFTSASSAAAGLQALADEAGAALIALGSSRRSGLERVLPGGTAERLLSGCSVPVAVAPGDYSTRNAALRVVGCGFDGSPRAHEALRWTAALARRTDARVQVLAVHRKHAFDHFRITGAFGTRSVSAELHARLRDRVDQVAAGLSDAVEMETALLEGDPAETLSEHSEQLDLLVLGSRGYGPLRSVLLGSVSAQVIRAAACAVVVVPRGGDPATTPSHGHRSA
jgi:nucleotide-binding universal stress UspA family protein